MKQVYTSILLGFSVFMLSGCVKLWQKNIEIKTYMIQVKRTGEKISEPLAGKLWIENVHVLPPYNIRSLILRESDVKFSSSYYSELLMSPSENFQNGFYQWLSDSGIFRDVAVLDRKGMSHRMVATVTDFYADQPSQKAILKIKVSFFDETNPDMRILLHQDYEQSVDVTSEVSDDVMRAYNVAFARILESVEQDLSSVLRKTDSGADNAEF